MKKHNVLVFPCGTEIANEIINSLEHNKHFKVKFASSEKNTYCNYRNKQIDHLPYVTADSFLSDLKKIIKQEKIRFIIPAHDDVAFALSQLEYIPGVDIIGQSGGVNEIVRFKDKTYSYFKGLLPIAAVYEKEEEVVFPFFVKPKRGQGAFNSFLLKTQKDFECFKKSFESDDFVWMEYLPGDEFTIDCFSDEGELLYAGARTREKIARGISVRSTLVVEEALNSKFQKFAEIISEELELNGLWFYQMKIDRNGELKLLEIGPRVSGTMMLNRARGVNFVELALFQSLGLPVEIVFNNIEVSVGRALVAKYSTNIKYKNLYIDFDDTLLIDEQHINTDLVKLVFQAKNEKKSVFLITKNKKQNLAHVLHRFGITNIFDGIVHLKTADKKVDFMEDNSLLVDDSFKERREVIDCGMYAFGIDAVSALLK